MEGTCKFHSKKLELTHENNQYYNNLVKDVWSFTFLEVLFFGFCCCCIPFICEADVKDYDKILTTYILTTTKKREPKLDLII